AEDGILDRIVTGVQTCALPIYQILYSHLRRRFRMEHVLFRRKSFSSLDRLPSLKRNESRTIRNVCQRHSADYIQTWRCFNNLMITSSIPNLTGYTHCGKLQTESLQ